MLIYRFREFYDHTILPNLGIVLSLISQLFNCIMVMFCKLLITDKDFETPIHPLQILFVRMIITYAFCVIYFVFIEKHPDFPFGPKPFRKYLFYRAFGGFAGVCGQYWSLVYLNLSDMVVITFLEPTVTAFMAYLTLGEVFTKVEAIGGLIAFCGVVLVAKPYFLVSLLHLKETEEFISGPAHGRLIGTCLALLSCVGTAVAMCSIRRIGFNVHPLFMVSVYALFSCFASFFGILLIRDLSFQIPHTPKQWTLLAGIGVAGFFMQYMLTAGMQREKAARAIAMTYTQLIYASIFDFIVNGIVPKGLNLVGEITIICAVFSIIYFKETTVSPDVDPERDVELVSYKDDELDEFDVDSSEEQTV